MNNSKLVIDSVSLTLDEVRIDKPLLRKREQELTDITTALRGVQASKEWSSLKIKLFDPLVETLNRDLVTEGKKEIPDTLKLSRLAGQLKWAEKYADLGKLEDVFRLELQNIKKLLYGKTEE